jgi:hypothetical protein
MSIRIRTLLTGAAIVLASHAAPASAQNATFTGVRDSVPARFFDADTTAADAGEPNTLVIGFHAADPFRASAEVGGTTGTRLATDTLSVVVTAPAGYYVSSVTCHVSGRGAVNTPADARAAANCVINGTPEDLGSVGGAALPNTGADWSLSSKTATLADPTLTVVPVSLTAQLFAFAAPSLASAEIDLTSATIVVTVSPTTASPRH